MKGVEAVADALRRYTDSRYTVPGFPITELGTLTCSELVVNEKTALEYALGDSLMGRRAAVIIKNVGVNACADPLLQATIQGIIGGIVLVAGDDVEARGSQTAQDSRYYGELADIPVIEPDASTCYTGVEAALEASERFSRVAMVRLTPPLLDGDAVENPVIRRDTRGRLADPSWTMNGRAAAARNLFREMAAWSTASDLNCWYGEPAGAGPAPGSSRIVTVYPPPAQAAAISDIREYGGTFVRDHRGVIRTDYQERPETMQDRGFSRTFCRDCPFLALMDLLAERRMQAVCDAGCSILVLNRPYGLGLASYGMGTSIAVAARSTRLALIGDYALLHSGLNALIDVYEKRLPLLCIVMKNDCTAMTGRQPAVDPLPYLRWADPVVCRAEDDVTLKTELVIPDRPRTLVVEGTCPEGRSHETLAY